MLQPISITAISSLSPLGNNPKLIWEQYNNSQHCFVQHTFGNSQSLVAPLDQESKALLEKLKKSDNKYKFLDDTVLMAIAASRLAVEQAGWQNDTEFGINIGSSRGATTLFENHHRDFLQNSKVSTLTSPTTTLGNISSWVSHDLQSNGPEISHSITCSTALHALLNGVAWLRAGMSDKFLVGGSEAPLTNFTIAQMQAMKIYAKENPNQSMQGELDELQSNKYPCRALDLGKKQNTMILGEGAAICCLEIGRKPNALAYIDGIGYATEVLQHNTSISAEANCFQKSMKMALQDTDLANVDAIVMHAPGTKMGDLTEFKAIQKIFGSQLPMLTTNKWKIGHTLGTSGMLNIEMAILMMQHQEFISVPFAETQIIRKKIRKVLVNAVGFGGNAVSVLLSL